MPLKFSRMVLRSHREGRFWDGIHRTPAKSFSGLVIQKYNPSTHYPWFASSLAITMISPSPISASCCPLYQNTQRMRMFKDILTETTHYSVCEVSQNRLQVSSKQTMLSVSSFCSWCLYPQAQIIVPWIELRQPAGRKLPQSYRHI